MKRSKNQGLQKKKLNFPSLRYAERAIAKHLIYIQPTHLQRKNISWPLST